MLAKCLHLLGLLATASACLSVAPVNSSHSCEKLAHSDELVSEDLGHPDDIS